MELRRTVIARRRMSSSVVTPLPGTRTKIIFGVLKNIHPKISNESIIDELVSNKVPVHRIYRLQNSKGPTYCVRVSFHTDRPSTVLFRGVVKKVHKYNPGVLICNNCSRPGHLAKYCRFDVSRCPICSGTHGKRDCPVKDSSDLSTRKCSNCEGSHSANSPECHFFVKEKKLVLFMVTHDISRREAKEIYFNLDACD